MEIADLIDLSNIKVTSVIRNANGHLHIRVETTESSVACRSCGKQITKRHGCDRERKLRHLPVFDNPTYIIYTPHRYICDDCDNTPTTTATPNWHKRDSYFTTDYENNVLLQVINSTVADVSIKENLTESIVSGIIVVG